MQLRNRNLRLEVLESRFAPAMVTVGAGPDYTLRVHDAGRFAVMEIPQAQYDVWRLNDSSDADEQNMIRRLYDHFRDDFDFIAIQQNERFPEGYKPSGFNIQVKNDVTGLGVDLKDGRDRAKGHELFDRTADFGSAGKLQSIIRGSLAISTHELMHRWSYHWYYAGVGGKLGGWAPGTLRHLGGNEYDADGVNGNDGFWTNSNGGNEAAPFAELELYLMGLIEADEVDPIEVAVNPKPGADEVPTNSGASFLPTGRFTADSIQTVTIEDMIAADGVRAPTPANSQKDFRILTVILAPGPLPDADLRVWDRYLERFMRPADDGRSTYNFWEATGGRASVRGDGLLDALAGQLPTISDIADQTTIKNDTAGPIAFTVGDAETPAGAITVRVVSSDTALVPHQNIVVGGSGANRTLTITPTADQIGTTQITVTVTDASGAEASDSFTLTVKASSEKPTISGFANANIAEDDSTGALPFTVGDAETPPAVLSLSGASSNSTLVPANNIVFGGSGADRTLTVTPAPNATGSATIGVTVTDAHGDSTIRSFLLTVVPVNDSPTISPFADQRLGEDGVLGPLTFTVGDPETAPGLLSVFVSSDNVALFPAGSLVLGGAGAERTLTLAPAANQFGAARVTVGVQDAQGGFAGESFDVLVDAVNDLPTIAPIDDLTTDEDTVIGPLGLTLSDVETPVELLTLQAETLNPALVPVENVVFSGPPGSPRVTITPTPDAFGSAVIAIGVRDAEGGEGVRSFTLTVRPGNDAPTAITLSHVEIPDGIDTSLGAVAIGVLGAVDVDGPGESFTFRLVNGDGDADNGAFEIEGGELRLRQQVVVDARIQDRYSVRVEVSDGQATIQQAFLLQVVDPRPLPLWQNPRNRWDVNDDDNVAIADALEVVQALRNNGNAFPLSPAATGGPPYLDVNGDDTASVADLLDVVQHLRTNLATPAEGERDDASELRPVAAAFPLLPFDDEDNEWELFVAQLAEDASRRK